VLIMYHQLGTLSVLFANRDKGLFALGCYDHITSQQHNGKPLKWSLVVLAARTVGFH
jgi:hypothetical protein